MKNLGFYEVLSENLGFYQVAKLLVTPAIVLLEAQLFGARMSPSRGVALFLVCAGVGVAAVGRAHMDPSLQEIERLTGEPALGGHLVVLV